jgi:hypothetical protein
MRSIRNFIVRILLDPTEPTALRGTVQALPEGKPEPFADAQSLLAMFHRADRSGPDPLSTPLAPGEEEDHAC